jgi:hypothetical protein
MRGVDETRAPTDPYSVFSATNFVNNLDGSFSLRKPLLIKRDWTRVLKNLFGDNAHLQQVAPLHIYEHYLIVFDVGGVTYLSVYDATSNTAANSYELQWYDRFKVYNAFSLTDNVPTLVGNTAWSVSDLFDVSELDATPHVTSTVLSGCTVRVNSEYFRTGLKEYDIRGVYVGEYLAEYDESVRLEFDGNTLKFFSFSKEGYSVGEFTYKYKVEGETVRLWYPDDHPEYPGLEQTYYVKITLDNGVPSHVKYGLSTVFYEGDLRVESRPALPIQHPDRYIAHPKDYSDYAGNFVPLYLKRYITIFKTQGTSTWCFRIHTPEVPTLEVDPDTGRYAHPLDTTLDDMYALDDTTSAAPTVLGIIPYVYTDVTATGPKPVSPVYESDTVQHSFTVPLHRKFKVSDGSATYKDTLYEDHGIEVVMETVIFPSLRQVNYTVKLQSSGISGSSAWDVHISEFKSIFRKDTFTDTSSLKGLDLNATKPNVMTMHVLYDSIDNIVGGEFELLCTMSINVTKKVLPNTFKQPILGTLTRSFKRTKFRGANVLPHLEYPYLLKAVCKFPISSDSKVYATWTYTLDGITWMDAVVNKRDKNMLENAFPTGAYINLVSEDPIEGVESDVKAPRKVFAVPFNINGFKSVYNLADTVATSPDESDSRIDVLKISKDFFKKDLTGATFRFTIWLVGSDSDGDGSFEKPYDVVVQYAQQDYTPIWGTEGEFWYSEFGNTSVGVKQVYNKRILSFGDSNFASNVFVSEPNEFVTPFKNIIDVNASKDVLVTSVVPWKDYLILTTPQAIYLASQVDTGYLTKTVNTALGVSQHDARCITPTLNGLIFKSENKIYMLYPNIYAGDDSVINVTEISKPVENFLFEHEPNPNIKPFAFGTESEYVLVLPEENCSKCLVYNYTTKLWNCLQFPVVFQYHVMHDLTDIVLFGNSPDGGFCEYSFNKSFAEAYGLTDSQIEYGDVLVEPENGIEEGIADIIAGHASPITVSPIEFELDTGQKSDQILTKKQFVETKIVIATSTEAPSVNMEVLVHVDGDPNITKDISTDSTFWKSYEGGGVLNTGSHGLSNSSDVRNILRQLVLRYSGKGNSVRHILKGTASSNFKLYETYIRYKLLNVKQ